MTAAGEQVFLWDPDTRNLIRPPLRHDAWTEVVSAAVSPDGRHVAAVGRNGVVMGWQVAGNRLDPDAAARLVRLLSCAGADRDEVVPASTETLEEDWNELRRAHPAELRPAADLIGEWHFAQYNALLNNRRFELAGRQVEITWPSYAADDWNKLITGACYLAADDKAGVRRTFAQLARIADADPTPWHLTRAIEVGLHDPEALTPAERTRTIALGDKVFPPGPQADAYWVLARALSLTRAGKLDEAEKSLGLVTAAKVPKIVRARANAQLAVVRRLQGRPDEAKKLADAATVELTPLESGPVTGDWISAVFLRRLVDEARRPAPKPAP